MAIASNNRNIIYAIISLAPELVTSDFFLISKKIINPELEALVLEKTGRKITDFKPEEVLASEENNDLQSIHLKPFMEALEYHQDIRIAIGKSFLNFFTNFPSFFGSFPKENRILSLGDYFYEIIGTYYIIKLNNPSESTPQFDDEFIKGFSLILERANPFNGTDRQPFFKKERSLSKEYAKEKLTELFNLIKPTYYFDNGLIGLWENRAIRACFHCALCILNDLPIPERDVLEMNKDTVEELKHEDFFVNSIEELNEKNDELMRSNRNEFRT